MHPMLNIAVKAARRAGGIINRASRNLDVIAVKEKAAKDFVSEVDREAEQAIIRTLREAYPGHAILAEESGSSGSSEFQWIIDPLDGTTNFLHGFPQYAISIALAHKGVITQAVVYDPVRNDLFTATKGRGAFFNESRLRVSKRPHIQTALIGTGFPYRQLDHLESYLGMMRDIIRNSAGLRRPGSAALDLAWVAAGRLDGFWELGLSKWDIAAGSLLINEAGGLVGNLQGNEGYLDSGNIVAGNPKIFAQLLPLIAPHLTAALRD
ncbi:MAG: inositol monophosphatase family protein [Betaproteobacteria bacterium]|jgi:myo-inositol-1(or 4)-monophosphatase|nr:inositol monophosphatase [Betaproteobacteria bacterium]